MSFRLRLEIQGPETYLGAYSWDIPLWQASRDKLVIFYRSHKARAPSKHSAMNLFAAEITSMMAHRRLLDDLSMVRHELTSIHHTILDHYVQNKTLHCHQLELLGDALNRSNQKVDACVHRVRELCQTDNDSFAAQMGQTDPGQTQVAEPEPEHTDAEHERQGTDRQAPCSDLVLVYDILSLMDGEMVTRRNEDDTDAHDMFLLNQWIASTRRIQRLLLQASRNRRFV